MEKEKSKKHYKKLRWNGSPQYTTEWASSTALWNALGQIGIEYSTSSSWVVVSTTTASDVSWEGLWSSINNPDNLYLNTFYLGSATSAHRINVISHELGHALGLGHSNLGNMMYYCSACQFSPKTSLGTQDTIDYNYCWGGVTPKCKYP